MRKPLQERPFLLRPSQISLLLRKVRRTISIYFVYEFRSFAPNSYKINTYSSPSLSVTGHPAKEQTVPFQSCGGAAAPPGREPALARALSQTGCVCAIETNPTINFNLKILLNLKAAGLQIYKIVRKN